MFASLLLLLLTQSPSTPGETPAGCLCEEQIADAAVKLVETVTAHIRGVEEASQKANDSAGTGVSDCSEPTECRGQNHHIISRPIAKELEKHKTLKGQYKPRDKRFVTRAVDEQAHCGYQQWHRDVGAEVIQWLKENAKATAKEFEAFLRLIYNRPDMRARFPHGF